MVSTGGGIQRGPFFLEYPPGVAFKKLKGGFNEGRPFVTRSIRGNFWGSVNNPLLRFLRNIVCVNNFATFSKFPRGFLNEVGPL